MTALDQKIMKEAFINQICTLTVDDIMVKIRYWQISSIQVK